MDGILISVIIVCRNSGASLERTLLYMHELNDPRLRLIVIDGASTDGTATLLSVWRDRLHHFVSEPDNGIYDAMNKGWRAAIENSHVLYLGAGDWPLTLPTSEETRNPDGTPVPVIIGDCVIGDSLFVSHWDNNMRFHNTAHHQSLLIYKQVHPEPPFDASLRIFGDWDFNLRLFSAGIRAKRVERFRSYAEPGGASSHPDLGEVKRVAQRHGGVLVGYVAWTRYRAFLIWRELGLRCGLLC
jgi:glycosyltransferase involved in cell wall biosynthesis